MDTATTEIYTYLHTLALHDALPISGQPVLAQPALLRRLFGRGLGGRFFRFGLFRRRLGLFRCGLWGGRSEEHTSELQSLMRISYAVFCLKKKTAKTST